MWNRNKKYRDWLRAQLGFKYQESMFPDEKEYPELNEEKILEAIHVISVASKLPEKPENSRTNNVPVFFMSDKPIAVDLCSDEIFREKEIYLDSNTYGKGSYTATIEIPYTTEFERFRQNIVDSQILVVRRNYYDQERYESQQIANRNRHTSRHVPFYFSIVGQSRFVPRKSGRKGHTKFNRNVRPKGTHSHFKFYK